MNGFREAFEQNTLETDIVCQKHNRKKVIIKKTNSTVCIKCESERLQEEAEFKAYQLFKRERKREKEFLLNGFSNLNRELKQATLDNYVVKNQAEHEKLQFAKRIAKEYENEKFNNVVLKGNTGAGKSHLAHGILEYLSRNTDRTAIFVNLVDLMTKVDFENLSHYVDMIVSADYCVLDDLGSEMTNRLSEKIMYEILDKRSRTIITTNLTGQDIIDRYGKRVYSRVMKGVDEKHFMSFDDVKDKRRLLF